MAKLFSQLIIILPLLYTIQSCKKGDNDPFLSLRTRKARFCGEWKVTHEDGKSNYNQSGEFNYSNTLNYSYNGVAKTTNSYGQSPVITSNQISYTSYNNTTTEQYMENYFFEEDGTFNYQYTNTLASSLKEFSGTWKFLPKNENGTTKNKETVLLEYTNCYLIDETRQSTTMFPGGFIKTKIYAIDELKNKEMILIFTNSYSNYDKLNHGSSYSTKTTTTLTSIN